MNILKKSKLKNYEQSMLIFISIISTILILLIVGLYLTIRELDDSHNSINESIISINKGEFNIAVKELTKFAEADIHKISSDIEYAIKEEYKGKMNQLKDELASDNYESLSKLISSYIKDRYFNGVTTDGNKIFIANYDGIIADFSYTTSNIQSNNTYKHWDELINNSYNKESCSYAIDKLIYRAKNPNNEIIIWQYNESKLGIKPEGEVTIDTLQDIYLEYGIKGMKSFELLIPSYITEDGDIFGQKDISLGITKKNYKLIAVQRVNLYDQIMNLYPDVDNHNIGALNKINIEYKGILFYVYLMGIIITAGFFVTIIYFCFMFNKYLDLSNKEEADSTNDLPTQ